MNKQSEKPRGLLSGKTVLLCVTGGIAAYKMPNVARMLKKLGCNVHVLMTQNATNLTRSTGILSSRWSMWRLRNRRIWC